MSNQIPGHELTRRDHPRLSLSRAYVPVVPSSARLSGVELTGLCLNRLWQRSSNSRGLGGYVSTIVRKPAVICPGYVCSLSIEIFDATLRASTGTNVDTEARTVA